MSRTHLIIDTPKTINQLSDLPKLAAAVIMSAKTFDPVVFLQSRVNTAFARDNIMSSLAWYADMMVLNSLRTLYFDLFAACVETNPYLTFGNYVESLNSREATEINLRAQGFNDGNSSVTALRRLINLRNDLHGRVEYARHVIPSFEQLIREEKIAPRSTLTVAKLRALSFDEACAGRMPPDGWTEAFISGEPIDNAQFKTLSAEAKEIFDELLLRENAQDEQRMMSLKERVTGMIHLAYFVARDAGEEDAEFSTLPVDVRRRLIEGLRSSIDQATMRLMKDRKTEVREFLAAKRELTAAKLELTSILSHAIFNDNVKLQSEIDDGRLEKTLIDKGFERVDDTAGSAWNKATQLKHVPMKVEADVAEECAKAHAEVAAAEAKKLADAQALIKAHNKPKTKAKPTAAA